MLDVVIQNLPLIIMVVFLVGLTFGLFNKKCQQLLSKVKISQTIKGWMWLVGGLFLIVIALLPPYHTVIINLSTGFCGLFVCIDGIIKIKSDKNKDCKK